MTHEKFSLELANVLSDIEQLLNFKNKMYGNSVFEPVRIFSRASPLEQMKVRIDDKLSRISKGQEVEGEDTLDDLIGYLVILKVAKRFNNERDKYE